MIFEKTSQHRINTPHTSVHCFIPVRYRTVFRHPKRTEQIRMFLCSWYDVCGWSCFVGWSVSIHICSLFFCLYIRAARACTKRQQNLSSYRWTYEAADDSLQGIIYISPKPFIANISELFIANIAIQCISATKQDICLCGGVYSKASRCPSVSGHICPSVCLSVRLSVRVCPSRSVRLPSGPAAPAGPLPFEALEMSCVYPCVYTYID